MFLHFDVKIYTFVSDYIYFKDEKIYMDSFKLNAKSYIINLLNNDLIGNIYILSFIIIFVTVKLSGMKSWLNVQAYPFVQFPLLK